MPSLPQSVTQTQIIWKTTGSGFCSREGREDKAAVASTVNVWKVRFCPREGREDKDLDGQFYLSSFKNIEPYLKLTDMLRKNYSGLVFPRSKCILGILG